MWGPDAAEFGFLAGERDDVIHSLTGHLGLPFGYEQPRPVVLARDKVALDSAQLVAGNRLLDGQRALEALHPKAGAFHVQLIPARSEGFGEDAARMVRLTGSREDLVPIRGR